LRRDVLIAPDPEEKMPSLRGIGDQLDLNAWL
jgi:hypothetical protein